MGDRDYLRALDKTELIGLRQKWTDDIAFAKRQIEKNKEWIGNLEPKLKVITEELEVRK